MGRRDNAHLLLDLDPGVADEATIQARIADKQKEWARQRSSGNAAQRRRAEYALSRLDDLRRVMGDTELRRADAEEARELRREQRRDEAHHLDVAIGVLRASGGHCDEAQVERLAGSVETFSRQEIEARLRKSGISVGEDAPPATSTRTMKPVIDPVQARDLVSELDHLELDDLYAFLELNPRSSPQALCDRAREIYRQESSRSRKDSICSARMKLSGLASTLLADDEAKERYDNYLAIRAMEDLKEHLELAGADGFLSQEVIEELVKQARRRGVEAEDARAFIEGHAAKRKWRLQRTVAREADSLRQCGFCFELTAAGASHCAGCGEPLEEPCPRCGQVQPSSVAACPDCGCRLGDAPRVRALLSEGKTLGRRGEWAAALEALDRALGYWPGWKPAEAARRKVLEDNPPPPPGGDLRVSPLAAGLRLSWEPAAEDGVTYRVVRKAGGAPHRADDGETVAEVAATQLDDAEAAVGEPTYYAVFSLRHGVASATAVIAGPCLRTADVGEVRARATDGEVRLSWRPPHGCRTVEVWRRTGRPPARRGDGTLMGTASDAWRDRGVSNGALYGYRLVALFRDPSAPFGDRETTGVTTTATPSVPEPPQPVRGLTARRSGRGLMLRWQWPDGCDEVVVRYSHDDFPDSPAAASGAGSRVTRREYDREAGWMLQGAERRPHFFAVFALDTASSLASLPARLVSGAGAKREVRYRVERRRGLFCRGGAPARVELTCNGDGSLDLPALLLVAKSGGVPVSPQDGHLLIEVTRVRLEEGHASIPLPASVPGRRPYLKLFFKDAAAAGQIRLLPAGQEDLRL